MDNNIVISPALRRRFEEAWKACQVILFSAPCGFGKTTSALALLEGRSFLRWDALEQALPPERFDCETALLDNIQLVRDPELQQNLAASIRDLPGTRFVLLSRGPAPGWLRSLQDQRSLCVFGVRDLSLNRESSEKLLRLLGASPTAAEMDAIQTAAIGYPLALRLLGPLLRDGGAYNASVDTQVRRELFLHYQEAVYRRFAPPLRRLLLDLAPFEPFDVELVRIVTANSRAGELLAELQECTSMLLYDNLRQYRFWPQFRQFLLWQQDREYSAEDQRALYSRAGLYYQLQEDYTSALACYSRCGDYQKVSELLVRNSELHPGLAHFDEMEPYYRALPREQILTSPALMCGMSMLCAVCMDYEESETWYQELKAYAARLKKSDAEYKSVQGRLLYLDVGLPQRSVEDAKGLIAAAYGLLSRREIVLPEFSVTSCLPSIMNGGKDFCSWSKIDDRLYSTLRLPVKLLLGRDGVGLPECAVAESKFEKGADISGRMLDLMGRLDEIQRKGTPDIEFALIGLLARLRISQGEAGRAREHLEALRRRFASQNQVRFLPNIAALLCRTALYEGNEAAVDAWYQEEAPDLKLRVMKRFQYLTRAMVEISRGCCQEALLILAPLRGYFASCRRVMDTIYLEVLTAICLFRENDEAWQNHLSAALDLCREYRFIQPIAQYAGAVLPLLEKSGWQGDKAFLSGLTAAARRQAALYPDFLRFRGGLEEPLLPAEMNVLRLLCRHKSNAEIGEILGIKLPTVKTHVSSVLRKLGVKNRGAARDAARRLRLLPEDFFQV